MFRTILVANRGEIAVRIERTCRELGIATVAVHSEVDRYAPHVLAADQSVCLGGDAPAESYLNADKIVEAARRTGAEAVHPGYGFLSENPEFAQKCADAGLCFIGPPPEVLHLVGDKTRARRLAADAGVPVIPGTMDRRLEAAPLLAEAGRLGFPLMVKAAGGGGGKGMRRVERAEDLEEALQRAASEALAAFGDGGLYLEKCISRPRHVEVQVLADHHGQIAHLFERECSIQRRHQKIIEESPSPGVDQALRDRLVQAAVLVAKAAGYRGAGTMEFLAQEDGSFHFMEVNPRLQVEHPVTEAITGLDLVALQIAIAAGEPLPFSQEQVIRRGHAIECRIYAEDPERGFLPSPGVILALQAPEGPGIRFDCGIRAGSTVPVQYDPILAKLVAWGGDRPAAIARLARGLRELSVLGVKTPVELLLEVVESDPFRQGKTNTAFLPDHFPDFKPSPQRLETVLLGWLAAELEGANREGSRPTAAILGGAGPARDPWDTLGPWRLGQGGVKP